MIDRQRDRDPVEQLADEFVSRYRSGESPSISEYTAKHPQYAEQIEELFPAVAMMEQLRTEERANRDAIVRRAGSAGLPEHIGDFEIIQEIGRGGMGIVYEAEQRSLGRRVAVKVLPKHVLLLDRHLKRFQREAQTAAKLHHTNIVPVFGVGEHDGLHYYVMPLIRGVGLDEVIRELRGGGDSSMEGTPTPCATSMAARDINRVVQELTDSKFPATRSNRAKIENGQRGDGGRQSEGVQRSLLADHWRTVARVGVQAAEALGHAHAHGTLHRDVKPSNLLISGDGVVSVADFGLARAVDQTDASRSGEVVGTLRYMAPEQVRGAVDSRSDIYSLGLTIYELLTLRPAFDDADRRRCTSGQEVGLEPARPRKVNGAIPRDLETIVLKCLAHEPSKRYQTAAALAADLQRFLEDRPIQARRSPWIERSWRWCRRNPALATMSAVAAVLLIAVWTTALAGFVQTRRAYDDAARSLSSAEATSQLALEALEDMYLQLSPDRIWISSDSDPVGEACACIGLRSSVSSMSSVDRTLRQVQASEETASLLENLLGFYDRLAEQVSNDSHVMLESAIASRRVGDIRQRLGQFDHAEEEYTAAAEKFAALLKPALPTNAGRPMGARTHGHSRPDRRTLTAPASIRTQPDTDATIRTELARTHNEIGNVRSARLENERAYESHENALSILYSRQQTGGLPEEYRYELARTLYFLASKRIGGLNARGGSEAAGGMTGFTRRPYQSGEYRKSAIKILEGLIQEYPDAPDYRFLLALCHRPSGLAPTPARSPKDAQGRQQAIRILEELKTQYPGVADYRYELTATYAWIHVGLFPWQGRSVVPSEAEQNLLSALEESQWLVTHNPTIPHYACSQPLILAKLGTLCWRTGRLAQAEDYFHMAMETQGAAVNGFPELPSHNRVLLEFFRLRLGQVHFQRASHSSDATAMDKSRGLLETCIENLTDLTKSPELAENRLARSSLPLANDILTRVLADMRENR
jgi:serine/threonine protein kinase